ncbi:M48 family metallopeptidase [Wenxinia marina]|uniref:Putative metal-dependent hydrolase n=1 Tax=Wenxinia marina DSM 24838 TaxID=1123501 RepID=A0A0D0Q9R3_9RHOB|nr:SprT family zinc-dependent metalloprotease [Wenxinia marina]KIQ69097.1 putative metal-dependent hydrolase [Wenxinia marina DSM 24838]GGL70242.1 zinc metalloprotease [Wenxinia marina]
MGQARLVGNPPIEVTVRRSARARRLSLRVSRLDGRVTLTLPRRTGEAEGLAFVAEREAWLRRHLADIALPAAPALGLTLPVEGVPRLLVPGRGRAPVLGADTLAVPGAEDRLGPRLAGFLKTLARERLSAASDRHAAALGRRYGRLTLRDTRSRWGSCSHQGDLMYCWRLVMAPPAVLDYVAAHEVAHLERMDHSPAFWEIVARLCPDHARHRRWLADHGTELGRWRFAD